MNLVRYGAAICTTELPSYTEILSSAGDPLFHSQHHPSAALIAKGVPIEM